MKRFSKKISAALIALVLVCSGMGQAYAADEKGIDYAKNGVVSIQFYLENAAYYAYDGKNLKKVEDINNGNDVAYGSGSGFL